MYYASKLFSQLLADDIVMDQLVFNVDAWNVNSYPGSGTTWFDLAGNYNGTIENSAIFETGNGGSFRFNGISSRINFTANTPLLYPGTSDFTASVWVKIPNFSGTIGTIWFGNAAGGANGLGITRPGGTNHFEVVVRGSSGGNQKQSYLINSYINSFHQYTIVLKQSLFQIKLYIDAILAATLQYSNWGSINKQPGDSFLLGSGTAYFPFVGNIASVKAYRKALSAEEDLQNFNATKSRFGL